MIKKNNFNKITGKPVLKYDNIKCKRFCTTNNNDKAKNLPNLPMTDAQFAQLHACSAAEFTEYLIQLKSAVNGNKEIIMQDFGWISLFWVRVFEINAKYPEWSAEKEQMLSFEEITKNLGTDTKAVVKFPMRKLF